MKKACVVGWPITHSRSPLIHQYWLNYYQIEGTYEKIAVHPDELEFFLRSLQINGYSGCNITVPHKETAIPFIDQIDQRVKRIGSLNTVYIRENKTHATSSDGEGFYQNFIEQVPGYDFSHKTITILGAGGAARAIIDRLQDLTPKSVTVVNRNADRASKLQDDLSKQIVTASFEDLPKLLSETELLINTTTLGMAGHPPLEIDLGALPKTAVVADIVYTPLETQLLAQANRRGLRTITGLGMLLHQAVVGFELWFGIKPEVTTSLKDRVLASLPQD